MSEIVCSSAEVLAVSYCVSTGYWALGTGLVVLVGVLVIRYYSCMSIVLSVSRCVSSP